MEIILTPDDQFMIKGISEDRRQDFELSKQLEKSIVRGWGDVKC